MFANGLLTGKSARASTIAEPSDEAARTWTELALWAGRMGRFQYDIAADSLEIGERASEIVGAETGVQPARGGEALLAYVFEDDRPAVGQALRDALANGQPYQVEHRGADGAAWLMSAGAPVKDAAGKVVRLVGVVQDISDRKASESQREQLIAEIDHRIKNMLAAIQSMALQSARKTSSLEVFLKTFSGRLKAMASAHTLLTATRWRGASIHHVVAAALGGLEPGQSRWEGPEMILTARATNSLALALHELATNAAKFGALSLDSGRIDVRWRPTAEGGFELDWAESGGPLVSPPQRQGFGATLLDKVTGRELGGNVKIEFLATGVRVRIVAGPDAVIPAVPTQDALPPADLTTTVHGASQGDSTPQRAARVHGLRVLIVEDSLLLSLELEAGLEEAGAKVIGQAQDLEEALSMVERPMDAAVLDANLDGQSVEPVAEALRARGVPFIFATGYGDDRWTPQGFTAPFIRKPYDVAQVAAALAEVTGRA